LNRRKFFAKLKRRNVYRAAVVYAMAAWLLVKIATQVFPFFDVPNWAVRPVRPATQANRPASGHNDSPRYVDLVGRFQKLIAATGADYRARSVLSRIRLNLRTTELD
jgi:hypothetical protein